MVQIISKAEAKQKGLTLFFTGKPCKHNHLSERYVSTGHCVVCKSEYGKSDRVTRSDLIKIQQSRWREGNKTERQRYNKEWRLSNEDHIKQYRSSNDEKIKKSRRSWRQRNPHRVYEFTKIRNTILSRAIPLWYEESKIQLLYYKRDELNKLWGTSLVVDHIIPINPRDQTVCGLHCWYNLQLLDVSLNSSKKDIYETDW